MAFHRLLEKQIKKHLGAASEFLGTPVMQDFLTAVDSAYQQSDSDRKLLERALDLTSTELTQGNQELTERLARAADSHSQLEQLYTIINSTLTSSRDGIILMDEDQSPILFNQRAAEFLDTNQDFIGYAGYADILKLLQNNAYNAEVFEEQLYSIEKNPEASTSGTLELMNGLVVEIYSQAQLQNGKVSGRVWNFHDITELRKNEREIRYRAFHDPLTGLPNRSLFSDRITTALSRQQRSDKYLALMFIDLDGFKYVNDTLGHEVGDVLLQEVAQRLQEVVRRQDTLARHGGDEFLILLEDVESEQKIREVAQRVLLTLAKVFKCDGQDIYISASIGISVAPQDGYEPEFLIRNADMAMYQAKNAGRNNYQFFCASMIERSSRQLLLQSQLHEALKKQEFALHFQPKIDLRSKAIKGAEALIRWNRDGEIIYPGDFIDAAEEGGLIIPISEWVIDAACAQLVQWQEYIADDFVLSINLSALHFKQEDLVQNIINCLNKYGIKPANFELELTESIVIDNPQSSIAKLNELRKHGLKLSIDDFGTGYSSFNYLKNLPITAIKIDKSFIQDIDVFTRDLALVKSIIDIAHTLELEVVAEGIETPQMQNQLCQANCDTAQGYLYSRPVNATKFLQLLLNYQPAQEECTI